MTSSCLKAHTLTYPAPAAAARLPELTILRSRTHPYEHPLSSLRVLYVPYSFQGAAFDLVHAFGGSHRHHRFRRTATQYTVLLFTHVQRSTREQKERRKSHRAARDKFGRRVFGSSDPDCHHTNSHLCVCYLYISSSRKVRIVSNIRSVRFHKAPRVLEIL